MELDDLELEMLKELVPYKTLAPTPLEIICYIKDLNRENERLNNIIDKAIEYIEKEPIDDEIEYTIRLLDILRGKDEDIKEIPQFEGTLEQLNKLSIRGKNNE